MAEEKTVKLRLLADSFNLYHHDEYGIPIKKRGYKRVEKGQTFDAPDYVADRLLKFEIESPMTGYTRRNAVVADSAEDPYKDDGDGEVVTLAPGVSHQPEHDFGSTRVDGTLISDPDGELAEQRAEARAEELVPEDKKKPQGKAASTSTQPQHPAQGQPSDKR